MLFETSANSSLSNWIDVSLISKNNFREQKILHWHQVLSF